VTGRGSHQESEGVTRRLKDDRCACPTVWVSRGLRAHHHNGVAVPVAKNLRRGQEVGAVERDDHHVAAAFMDAQAADAEEARNAQTLDDLGAQFKARMR
jgi:hypothetical protein